MSRINFPKYASPKAKKKVIAQKAHKKKPGRITTMYNDKTDKTKDTDFMARGNKFKAPKPVARKTAYKHMQYVGFDIPREIVPFKVTTNKLPDIMNLKDIEPSQ